jgi:AcrR family transcriptional regulator
MSAAPARMAASLNERARQRAATRARLLEASMAEFRRVGVPAAQVEDIVRAAGVARGTFYLHFPTKDHVLLESVCRDQEPVAARLQSLLDCPPRVFLRAAVDQVIRLAAGEVPAVSREKLIALARHATDLGRERMPLGRVATDYFRLAQARDEVRRELTPAQLAATFFPGVLGVLLLGPTSRRLRARLHEVMEVFVRGIVS